MGVEQYHGGVLAPWQGGYDVVPTTGVDHLADRVEPIRRQIIEQLTGQRRFAPAAVDGRINGMDTYVSEEKMLDAAAVCPVGEAGFHGGILANLGKPSYHASAYPTGGFSICTTGFLRIGPDDYLLFKNKDFGRTNFDDRLVIERDVFGVEGITTWLGSDPALDEFSGFLIGANSSGLLVCDSNVRTLADHANYDDLVEIALREGTDVESGIAAVRRAVAARPYLWGNLVLVDRDQQGLVEVRSRRTAVLRPVRATARANHHTRLGIHPRNDDTETTEARMVSAQRRLDEARSVEDVFALLRSHDQGYTGVCNHALYATVYSYVLRHTAGTTTLTVGKGRPCEEGPRAELPLPLGAAWSPKAAADFGAAYPSERVLVSG